MTESKPNSAISPFFSLFQMMTGYWNSQAIYVAAKLGIADLLANGPRSVEELALASHTHAPSLKRLLRALASTGVFTETFPNTFALTPISALLRTDNPESMRAPAIMYNEEQYRAWGDLLYSIQTGNPAFERHFDTSYFPYLSQHPEANGIFNEAMSGLASQYIASVVGAYDFTPFQTIVDVGGGHGALLKAILERNLTARGILFDQPHVVDNEKDLLAMDEIAGRCSTVGGDFFVDVPPGGDIYLLSQILHDWDDEHSIAILRQCRREVPAKGKLLVIELVLPSGDEPSISKWLDLHMLVLFQGGRERTAAEYDALFHAAGFALTRVVPMNVPQCILEVEPIDP